MLVSMLILWMVIHGLFWVYLIHSAYSDFVNSITNFDRYMAFKTTYDSRRYEIIHKLEKQERELEEELKGLEDEE